MSEGRKSIYFCGSIRGGRQDQKLYEQIIQELKSKYGEVLTEIVGNANAQEVEGMSDPVVLHREHVKLLQDCDVVVAEVTQPSLGVGYEIGRAVTMGKKTLCLFRPEEDKKLSCMIRGLHDGTQVIVRDYKVSDIATVLQEFFKSFSK